jgi:uncharacterized SAM-binding protein YcdF (DUF218 family)
VPIAWTACPPDPLPWIDFREALLFLLNLPHLFLPLLAGLFLLLLWPLPLRRRSALALSLSLALLASLLYSPLTTAALDRWLHQQLPPPSPLHPGSPLPVAVLPGRGPRIALATTSAAVTALRLGAVSALYVSGDDRSTAERLVSLGASPSRVAGDSCARTTWENATVTAAWLRRHHPGAPVLLITDPWQLPRASRAFRRQGLAVIPQAATPPFYASERNRLALREAAGFVLYALQQRT